MVCSVRYLSSAGIHRREIPGIGALAQAYSQDWLLYASLQCFPRGELPIEMDAMVVMGDRVLILELKDFNGKLTHNGDQWILNRRRFCSPVQGITMKARKVHFLHALERLLPRLFQFQGAGADLALNRPAARAYLGA